MRDIKVYVPYLDEIEKYALSECIDDNWITGGKKLAQFQETIARIQGAKYAVACNNGTIALYLALREVTALEKPKDGDEVIVPDFTFVASANAVVWAGMQPKFVDIDKANFCISPDATAKAINKQTRAIMPVHIYGHSADMKAINELANRYKNGNFKEDIPIVEDAAQGLCVTWESKPTYGWNKTGVSCMSFYADKTITTGEGGMVLTNSPATLERLTRWLNQGRTGRGWYVHDAIGYNFRMTDLQAAIGLAQLTKLDFIIKRKHKVRDMYYSMLKDLGQVNVVYPDKRCFDVPFRINIMVDNPEALGDYLLRHGIHTMRFFYPLHRQPCYSYLHLEDKDFPNSVWAYEHGLSLPSYPLITDDDVIYIGEKIREYFKK